MSETLIVLISLFAFLIVFPLFWSAIIGGFAVFGGWRELARDYPGTDASAAEWKHMRTAHFGGIFSPGRYRGSLSVGKDTSQLHLKQIIFFRPFHPPISIPLNDIHLENISNDLFLTAKLTFRNSRISMRINGKLADWALRQS